MTRNIIIIIVIVVLAILFMSFRGRGNKKVSNSQDRLSIASEAKRTLLDSPWAKIRWSEDTRTNAISEIDSIISSDIRWNNIVNEANEKGQTLVMRLILTSTWAAQ